jgi:hypothetical protein
MVEDIEMQSEHQMEHDWEALRVLDHPILGKLPESRLVHFTLDGQSLTGIENEPILAALAAHDIPLCRTTPLRSEPRWFYCGIGRYTDCMMIVDGVPNVRTCVTPLREGMCVETQQGVGHWNVDHDEV